MLSLTKLADADYLLNQVALGIDEYYLGGGEAPGVWHGVWAADLGLEGVVDADDLRALLEGCHPVSGEDLLAGRPARRFEAYDATLSAPKSVSLLWALATPEVSAAVSIAHVEAVTAALDVLEARAGLARRQVSGVRRREATSGLAVATFVHRTSREGDPQLHSHCVIPNLVRRADGSHVALDGGPVYEWKKAVGSIYQEELRWRLSARLGVSWGPDRNGCREMEGFGASQLRAFSKRSVAIEAHLAAMAIDHADRAAFMAADEAASLATRPPKDSSLTPERLLQRWVGEAAAVGLGSGAALDQAVCNRREPQPVPDQAEIFAHLADPDAGLCARRSRFGEAHVVEAVAAAGAGRLDARAVLGLSRAFLDSGQAVRLVAAPDAAPGPPRWSTPAHLGLEARVLGRLGELGSSAVTGVDPALVEAALAAGGSLGDDQAAAVRALCAPGAALRALVAPAGHGKTTTVAVAAAAQAGAGRAVVGLATTNQAVTELAAVGLDAMTLARFRLGDTRLAPGTVVIVDLCGLADYADTRLVKA